MANLKNEKKLQLSIYKSELSKIRKQIREIFKKLCKILHNLAQKIKMAHFRVEISAILIRWIVLCDNERFLSVFMALPKKQGTAKRANEPSHNKLNESHNKTFIEDNLCLMEVWKKCEVSEVSCDFIKEKTPYMCWCHYFFYVNLKQTLIELLSSLSNRLPFYRLTTTTLYDLMVIKTA